MLSRLTVADMAGAVEIGAAILSAIAWVATLVLLGAAAAGDQAYRAKAIRRLSCAASVCPG